MSAASVPKKLATIYERAGGLYAHSYAQTTEGLWIFSEPLLNPRDDAQEVGAAVRECLAASCVGVPHRRQSDWNDLTAPLLALAGVTSFDAFAAGAKCVQIGMSADVITLIPLRNEGPREGFTSIEEKSQTITPTSDEDLGAAVLGALAMAE